MRRQNAAGITTSAVLFLMCLAVSQQASLSTVSVDNKSNDGENNQDVVQTVSYSWLLPDHDSKATDSPSSNYNWAITAVFAVLTVWEAAIQTLRLINSMSLGIFVHTPSKGVTFRISKTVMIHSVNDGSRKYRQFHPL